MPPIGASELVGVSPHISDATSLIRIITVAIVTTPTNTAGVIGGVVRRSGIIRD
tara:strand:- start:63 stop:224 length:162 start_codon:yes stop_codon:yes gene_type:complete